MKDYEILDLIVATVEYAYHYPAFKDHLGSIYGFLLATEDCFYPSKDLEAAYDRVLEKLRELDYE